MPASSAPNACSIAATVISAGSSRIARSTASATCSGLRVPAPRGSVIFVSANIPASRMKPGEIVVTPTPVPWRSSRNPSEKPRSPNLVAEYMLVPGPATFPEIDEMNTICPRPRSSMPTAAMRAIMIGARRLTSSARSICSGVNSRSGPLAGRAAFATSTSRGPASRMQRSTSARSARSATTVRAPIASASGASASARRPLTITSAPVACSARAIACPIPPFAPVTSAFMPFVICMSPLLDPRARRSKRAGGPRVSRRLALSSATRTPRERSLRMKAAVYYENGPPSVFRYEDVPDPPLRAGSVRIDVRAIAVEGGDVLNRAGGALTSTPHVVGYNCAGVVRDVAPDVTDRKPGDRVTALMMNGSHAAMVAVPTSFTWLVPSGCSLEHAACVPVSWGTAHDCLFEFGRLQAGETVLVQAGTSGVGVACVQLAKRAGARVLATSSSDDKLARLRAYGMDVGINYRTGSFVEAVRQATNGRGADLVVDSVGGKTLEGSIQSVAYRGRVITVGNVSREGKRIDIGSLSGFNASITGVFFGLETVRSSARVTAMRQTLLHDIARGELTVVVDRTFPLSEAGAAHAYIESRAALGRVVLIP